MNNPFISVILSTYNRAWCIERAINSVLRQTYKNFELIIVDDGSTDNTNMMLKEKNYLNNESIKYIYLEKNKGVNNARNVGFENASGDLIMIFDSDDELIQDALQTICDDYHLISDSSLGCLLYRIVDQQGQVVGKFPEGVNRLSYVDFIAEEQKITGDFVKVFKSEIIEKHNFRYPNIRGGFPFILTLSIFKIYDVITHDRVLYIYHEESKDRLTGGGQISRRAHVWKIYSMFLEIFKADYELYNTKKLAYFYLEKGIFELIDKRKTSGRSSLLNAIKYNKKKRIIALAIYTCSFLPYNVFIFLLKTFHRFKKILK
jgi:glycosyltransferase involved in cell wall biosynthesis